MFTFFVSLYKEYKELLEPTFLACLIDLDSLCEVFGCSIKLTLYQWCFGFQNVLIDE